MVLTKPIYLWLIGLNNHSQNDAISRLTYYIICHNIET